MNRSPNEVKKDLIDLESDLRAVLNTRGAILYLDLQFFADKRKDLLQELRIAEASQ